MGKNDFLTKLAALLSRVPEHDRKEMLYDYEEHFEIGLAKGKSEAEIIAELGDPHVIVRDLLADYRLGKLEKENPQALTLQRYNDIQKTPSIGRAIGASIGLGFFNLIFIVGPVAGLFAAYVALCAVSFVLTVLPLAIMGSYFFGYSYETFAVNFFVSLTSFSLGGLMGIGMIYIGRFFRKTIFNYIKFNVRVVKGEKAA
jgi:uncharacterized membrane protein